MNGTTITTVDELIEVLLRAARDHSNQVGVTWYVAAGCLAGGVSLSVCSLAAFAYPGYLAFVNVAAVLMTAVVWVTLVLNRTKGDLPTAVDARRFLASSRIPGISPFQWEGAVPAGSQALTLGSTDQAAIVKEFGRRYAETHRTFGFAVAGLAGALSYALVVYLKLQSL